MNKMPIKALAAAVMATSALTANAADLRLVTGGVMPNGEGMSTATGLEVGFLTSPRTNGIAYGVKLTGMLNDFEVNNGGYISMDLELIYRADHKLELYAMGGGVYQSINDYDNAYGWEAGIGFRYTWCSGFQLGIEGKSMQLTYQSGQPSTALDDGDQTSTVVLDAYVGWRFE